VSSRSDDYNAAAGTPEKGPASGIPSGGVSLRFTGQRILVADDNPAIRDILVEILAHAGLCVTAVCNGAEAVEAISRTDFDLVLMDIEMPKMDGLTAVRQLRGLDRPGNRSLPILAITANVSMEDVEMSFRAGMNSHISKPFKPEAVLREIHRFLCLNEENRQDSAGRVSSCRQVGSCLSAACHPLDITQGIRLVGGDRALYEELLRRFVLEYREKGDEIRKETETGNISKAAYIAYGVREIAGLLAAGPLQSAAARIELELRCTRACGDSVLEQFQRELAHVIDFYHSHVQNGTNTRTDLPPDPA
jgi:CheY-like chemotaxis protein